MRPACSQTRSFFDSFTFTVAWKCLQDASQHPSQSAAEAVEADAEDDSQPMDATVTPQCPIKTLEAVKEALDHALAACTAASLQGKPDVFQAVIENCACMHGAVLVIESKGSRQKAPVKLGNLPGAPPHQSCRYSHALASDALYIPWRYVL